MIDTRSEASTIDTSSSATSAVARAVIGPSLIASYASSENDHAAKRPLGHLQLVDSIVMNLEAIEAHCNRGTA